MGWAARNGRLLRELDSGLTRDLDASFGSACFSLSPTGNKVVMVLPHKRIVWDAESGYVLKEIRDMWASHGLPDGCSMYPQGDKAVSFVAGGTAIIWDANSGTVLQELSRP